MFLYPYSISRNSKIIHLCICRACARRITHSGCRKTNGAVANHATAPNYYSDGRRESVLDHKVGVFAEMLEYYDGIAGRGICKGHAFLGGILCDKILVVGQLTETNTVAQFIITKFKITDEESNFKRSMSY